MTAYYLVFTTLHGMQTRSYEENSVCLSVCPSVCLSNAGIVTKRNKDMSKFLYYTKIIYPTFLRRMVVGRRPLLLYILGQPTPVGAKSPILNQ